MAIDDPLDEHEQSERVLEWLRNNGAGLVGGVLLGFAAIGGWKWWQHQQQQQQLERAKQYQAALVAITANPAQAAARVEALGDGIYAVLARLQLADAQVAADQSDAAIATLRAVKADDPALAAIVNQRLARLLIDADQAEAALPLLDGATTAAALEVRGDAQFALGRAGEARQAYQQALVELDVASPRRRLIELKLTQVGAPPATTEVQS